MYILYNTFLVWLFQLLRQYIINGYNKRVMDQSQEYRQYVVSHSEFKYILMDCDLTEQDILDLPQNATVVDVGSGLHQEFARGMKELRPDIRVISVDPTLAFDPLDPNIGVKESGSWVTYYVNNVATPIIDRVTFRAIQSERLKMAQQLGMDNIKTDPAPSLPGEDASVDLLVDSKGPALYLKGDEFKQYIFSIAQKLKNGGTARLIPLDYFHDAIRDILRRSEKIEKVKSELERLLEGTKLTIEKVYIKNWDDIGVILKKNASSIPETDSNLRLSTP